MDRTDAAKKIASMIEKAGSVPTDNDIREIGLFALKNSSAIIDSLNAAWERGGIAASLQSALDIIGTSGRTQ